MDKITKIVNLKNPCIVYDNKDDLTVETSRDYMINNKIMNLTDDDKKLTKILKSHPKYPEILFRHTKTKSTFIFPKNNKYGIDLLSFVNRIDPFEFYVGDKVVLTTERIGEYIKFLYYPVNHDVINNIFLFKRLYKGVFKYLLSDTIQKFSMDYYSKDLKNIFRNKNIKISFNVDNKCVQFDFLNTSVGIPSYNYFWHFTNIICEILYFKTSNIAKQSLLTESNIRNIYMPNDLLNLEKDLENKYKMELVEQENRHKKELAELENKLKIQNTNSDN